MNADALHIVEFLTGSRAAATAMPWTALGPTDLRVIRDWASETQHPAAQRRIMAALRHAIRTGDPPEDADDLAPRIDLHLCRSLRRRATRPLLSSRAARLLVEACSAAESPRDRRDAAVVALILLAGLRRREVAALQRADYEDDDARLLLRSPRAPARYVYLDGPARDLLDRWLDSRGPFSGSLFLRFDSRGHPVPSPLAPSTVSGIVAMRAWQAGCSGVTPSELRRLFLWQLRSPARSDAAHHPAFYTRTEDGQPAWALASLPPP